jgi:hypothetical protein
VDHIIPSLAELLEPFRHCFRFEAFDNFRHVVAAWILCPGTRTLSEVWQASALPARRHFDAIYHLFSSAEWEWDEIGALLCLVLLARLLPEGLVTIAVDDTLCRKRGARVAFGGMFLDPVQSSKGRKVLSFGVNFVVLGLVVTHPFRPDRVYCLPVLWRVFKKKGLPGHKKRTAMAAAMAGDACALMPDRDVCLVADSAYINAAVLRELPANLRVIGPLPLKAALNELPGPRLPGQRGRTPMKGKRLPSPRESFAAGDLARAKPVALPGGREKRLRLRVLERVLWYSACKTRPVKVVLVRDPSKAWPDTALLCTDPSMPAAEVVAAYARRWSIEVAFRDSKQYLGLQEPRVRTPKSVERAHAMAFFCYTLAALWHALHGEGAEAPRRDRPWYGHAVRPAFPEMLGTLRLALWRGRYFGGEGDGEAARPTKEMVDSLMHCLATVR